MKTKLLFFFIVLHSLSINAQIYTPNSTIQGLSWNDNVGIGTINPNAKLEIFNIAQAGHLLLSANDNAAADATRIDIDFRVANKSHTIARVASIYEDSADNGSGGLRFYTRYKGSLIEKIRINSAGNVGIGTLNPTSKLTVAGNINAREVKVTVDAGADFVFEKDYDLPSLESVNQFIKENKHLPEIASAQEMQKDGINLSEMNIKILQKIEEMTLYMIEMKKEIETLKKNKK